MEEEGSRIWGKEADERLNKPKNNGQEGQLNEQETSNVSSAKDTYGLQLWEFLLLVFLFFFRRTPAGVENHMSLEMFFKALTCVLGKVFCPPRESLIPLLVAPRPLVLLRWTMRDRLCDKQKMSRKSKEWFLVVFLKSIFYLFCANNRSSSSSSSPAPQLFSQSVAVGKARRRDSQSQQG